MRGSQFWQKILGQIIMFSKILLRAEGKLLIEREERSGGKGWNQGKERRNSAQPLWFSVPHIIPPNCPARTIEPPLPNAAFILFNWHTIADNFIKHATVRPVNMTHKLRLLDALPKNQDSITSTHTEAHNNSKSSSALWEWYTCTCCLDIHEKIPTQIKYDKVIFNPLKLLVAPCFCFSILYIHHYPNLV